MKLRCDFVYHPADPEAYQALMDSIGPSIRRSPSLLDKPVNVRKKKQGGNSNMQYGTVKWFNAVRGYGYIVQDEQGAEDVFVHFSAIKGEGFRTLEENDRVAFGVEQTDKGLRAVNVSVIVTE